ncbi:MAG: hypothetical protein KAS32_27735 [Candidatus Peribacteraceae bacterium]|nr:hypothetical protein [Candidatus Peribacteraceae bacterium]
MSRIMRLYAMVGDGSSKDSVDSVSLGYTKEEWEALSDEDQNEVIDISLGTLAEIWVAPEGDEDEGE